MVGERLKLRAQQQQLSQKIIEATADVAEMARGGPAMQLLRRAPRRQAFMI